MLFEFFINQQVRRSSPGSGGASPGAQAYTKAGWWRLPHKEGQVCINYRVADIRRKIA
jgi:hypothetical protein